PEITSVGKKAITLPFARRGQVYDVDVSEAPPADSSILGQPPSMSLLSGSLPRYEQREMPWRFSAEGSLGSFTTANARGYFDYKGQQWGIVGDGGLRTTQGHTRNASASAFLANAAFRSIVATDNELVNTFSACL